MSATYQAADDEQLALLERAIKWHPKLGVVDDHAEERDESTIEAVAKLDDIGRPLLGLKPHDYQHGWFITVARRHGLASEEVQQAHRFVDEAGQFFMFEAGDGPKAGGKQSSVSSGGRTVTIKAKDTKELAAKLARAGKGGEKGKGA